MGRKDRFDFKLRFEDQPIFNAKNKTLDDLDNSIKTLRRKFN